MTLAFPKPEPLQKERKRLPRSSRAGRLVARAERACSRMAKQRALGRCEFCGVRGDQTQHIFGKGAHPSVRFDGRNLIWSCHACHRRGERDRAWLLTEAQRIVGKPLYFDLLKRVTFEREPRYAMDDPALVLECAKSGMFLIERS